MLEHVGYLPLASNDILHPGVHRWRFKDHVRRIMQTNVRRREFERRVTGVVPLEIVNNNKIDFCIASSHC